MLPEEYEASLSWRVTRPLRALGRIVRPASPPPPEPEPPRYDALLDDERLAAIDAACAGGAGYEVFRELETDVWALLLTQQYTIHPHIRALLPDVPHQTLQELWNGASGAGLAAQTAAFYERLRARSGRPLQDARVLDFGCGWGRILRFLARDVAPGGLHGCDPSQGILDACVEARVPAAFARSEPLPEQLPFEGPFDLVYAFSVFTHLSEAAQDACLAAIRSAMAPGGRLVVTVRPLEYLRLDPQLHALADEHAGRLDEPLHLFVPHPVDGWHPQHMGGEMHYGETVVTPAYVREHWSRWFELEHTDLLIGDLYQRVLTLRPV